MSRVIKQDEPDGVEKRERLKKRLIPVLILLLIIAIVVGVFFFYRNYPEQVSELKNYGYPGIFLISLILNASIILPVGDRKSTRLNSSHTDIPRMPSSA